MPILIIQKPQIDCLHKYFSMGDEVEFDFRSCTGYQDLEGFPESPWRGMLIGVGCTDMLVKPSNLDRGILVNNPQMLVRLITPGPFPGPGSPSGHRRIVGIT